MQVQPPGIRQERVSSEKLSAADGIRHFRRTLSEYLNVSSPRTSSWREESLSGIDASKRVTGSHATDSRRDFMVVHVVGEMVVQGFTT